MSAAFQIARVTRCSIEPDTATLPWSFLAGRDIFGASRVTINVLGRSRSFRNQKEEKWLF